MKIFWGILAMIVLLGVMVKGGRAGSRNYSLITGQVFSGASGIAGLNLAAGEANSQLNLRGIGLGAPVLFRVTQQGLCSPLFLPEAAFDLISGEAFSGIKGLFSLNQAAGVGTSEANLLGVSIGREAGDALLAQSTGMIKGYVPPTGGKFIDAISGKAFEGARGVVQINQSAGSGNAISNQFSLGFKGPVPWK